MRARILLLPIALAATLAAQSPIDEYMKQMDVAAVAEMRASDRESADVRRALPHLQVAGFVNYVTDKSRFVDPAGLRSEIERLRMNKLVGNTTGGSGTTSLVSRVAVPGLLGFATEYGSILQTTSGASTTLRGNLLGIVRLAFGNTQFPNCALIQTGCPESSAWLRRFSGILSFENVRSSTGTGGAAATATTTTPIVRDLFRSDYRMASWGARFDLTHNDPDDPAYVDNWRKAMDGLKSSPAPAELDRAVFAFFNNPETEEVSETYQTWLGEAVPILQGAPSRAEFRRILEEQLDVLMVRMSQADPKFAANLAGLRRGLLNYTTVRDDLLQAIQSHKASLEYTNQHPLSQPSTSNLRFVYSHMPAKSETLLTMNAAFTVYNSLPSGLSASRLRDVQLAGQLDRQLGEIPSLGRAVATFGAYYQWMKEDALIVIGPGDVAPGSGVVLAGTAATLLGTKGHIGIVQGKLSIPVNSVVKIPVSVTWSNRAELIKEKDLRGQVGLTLDLDSLFKK